MKRCFWILLFTFSCVVGINAGETKSPRVTTVEPDTGKVGEFATAKGENLDKDVVAELFLTDGKNDVKVEITDRGSDMIKFKIPQIKAGRYRLMTASKTAMIEQPVVLEVSEP